MTSSEQMKRFRVALKKKLKELPPIVGKEVVLFSRDNFKKEAWQGKTVQPWPRRKATKRGKPDDGHPLLRDTGKGFKSVRVGKIEDYKVWVYAGGNKAPYMRVHNFGFRGTVKQQVSEHTRRNRRTGKTVTVKPFARTINQNIPQRQFIGRSPALTKRIRSVCTAELRHFIKNYKS